MVVKNAGHVGVRQKFLTAFLVSFLLVFCKKLLLLV
jgi:hypothetical protein